MVTAQLEYMISNVRQRLQSQGVSLEMLGMNEAVFRITYRPTAVRQVQGALILEAVARQEGIKVEDDELNDKLKDIAGMSDASLEEVKRHYASREARHGLMVSLIEEKMLHSLIEQAQVREVEPEELKAQEKGSTEEPAATGEVKKKSGKKKQQE